MAAVFAFDTSKAVVQITTVEITIDHLLDIGPPEAVLTSIFMYSSNAFFLLPSVLRRITLH